MKYIVVYAMQSDSNVLLRMQISGIICTRLTVIWRSQILHIVLLTPMLRILISFLLIGLNFVDYNASFFDVPSNLGSGWRLMKWGKLM